MTETQEDATQSLTRFDARLTDKDFARFSRLVYDHCGIKLPPHKQSMLEARLRKRLRGLIREEVAATVSNPAEVDAELAELFALFSPESPE